MKLEIGSFLKNLLDVGFSSFNEEFFNLFYTSIFPVFIQHLKENNDQFTNKLILEVFIVCGTNHGHRICSYVIHNSIIQELRPLFTSKNKAIRLAILRFFRSLIIQNNTPFTKYIIKHDLFNPIFSLLAITKRDNAIFSGLVETFNIILTEKMEELIAYIINNYQPIIDLKYAKNFIMIKMKEFYQKIHKSDEHRSDDEDSYEEIKRAVHETDLRVDEDIENLKKDNHTNDIKLSKKRPAPEDDPK